MPLIIERGIAPQTLLVGVGLMCRPHSVAHEVLMVFSSTGAWYSCQDERGAK